MTLKKSSIRCYKIRFYLQFYSHILILLISNFSYFVETNNTNKGKKKRMLIKFYYYCCIICLDDTELLYFTACNYDNIIYFDSSLGLKGEHERNKVHCLALIVNK